VLTSASIAWKTSSWSHPFFFSAARCAIHDYLHLYDHQLKDEPSEEELREGNALSFFIKKEKVFSLSFTLRLMPYACVGHNDVRKAEHISL